MKKIIFCLLATTLCCSIKAQNILPNAGFETWNVNPNYDDPAGWGTINGLTYILGVRTVTKATAPADVHGGSFAIKLESKAVIIQGTAPGIAATGAINQNGYIDGGLAYARRPISMSGWYKYTPSGTDTASVEATLSKWVGNARVEVGRAVFTRTASQAAYTQFTVNFSYSSALIPDTLIVILLTSSRGSASPVGSKLWIDDLSLDLCSNFSASASNTSATCTAGNGSVIATVTAGTGNLTYSWSGGGSTATVAKPAGTYTVTVSDQNFCTATASTTVTATSTTLSSTPASTPATCTAANGSASVTVTNGTPTYSYLWSNSATAASAGSVSAGTYTVTINDANGCSGTASVSVSANTTTIVSTITSTPTTCGANTGSAEVTPTNGTGSYTYLWNTNGTAAAIANLGAGNYQVTVTDANGCSGTASTAVTTPNGPSATQSTTHVSCNGAGNGAIDITTTGGTGSITYAWSPADTTEDLSSLSGGTYSLTITDANNCSFTISALVNEPAALSATETHTLPACFGDQNGSIDVTAAGGTPGYNYLWRNGTTTEDLSNQTAGSDTLVVTDANNCTAQIIVNLTEPTLLAVTLTPTDATTQSATDGAVSSLATGGTTTYSYIWSNSTSGEELTGLGTGNYCITVTDQNLCTATACATVSAPTALNDFSVSAVFVYPNPARTQLNISSNGIYVEQINIYNATGSLILAISPRSTLNSQLPIVSLSSGIYFIEIKSASGIAQQRFVKM